MKTTTSPLVISVSSLPNGNVGQPYSATLSATGGTAPYLWTVSPALPSGLTLNSSTGVISGTPTSAVDGSAMTVKVTDSSNPMQSASANLDITVHASVAPLAISVSSLPNGNVGQPYSATLSATGGTAPYLWTVSPALPSGLTLNSSTGVISGTPTSAVNGSALVVTVSDSSSPVQSASANLNITVHASVPPLAISVSSLPNGNVGQPYSATLSATGGTAPYLWTVSPALPSGLTLNSSTGVISGTPTSAANAAALVVTVTDSSSPVQSASVNLKISIFAKVAVSPQQIAAAITQSVAVQSATNDPAGVNWSASGAGCSGSACGAFSSINSLNGVATDWTAPSKPGAYTLTAVSAGDGTTSASLTVEVTDLAGVSTVHYDQYRDGANAHEYALTPTLVSGPNFGKLFSCTVDGAIYAQPLWAPQLTIGGAKHNVIFVATQHDSLFAFDADSNTSPCTPLWEVSLIDSAHGANSGETTVPSYGPGALVGQGYGDIAPEVGVTSTPVIDQTTQTIYVLSKSVDSSQTNFYQRLHAIDMTTGNEKFSGPATINATYPGTYSGGTTDTFDVRTQGQRAGLTLSNGTVYIAWASHEIAPPYCGWVMAYSAATLQQQSVLNITPDAGEGGIWMDGDGLPADASGNVYVSTGNGTFDADSTTPPNNDYGDTVLQMNKSLGISQYFTPSDQLNDDEKDLDLGSGGPILIDLPANGTNPTHLLVTGGKDTTYYVVDRDKMGGYGNAYALQLVYLGSTIMTTPAWFNDTLYLPSVKEGILAYPLNPQTAQLASSPSSATPNVFGYPGGMPVVSANPDGSDAILWAIDVTDFCTPQSPGCGPAVLHAYSAGNLATELWNSGTSGANVAGYPVKFTEPTVANGHVYIGTRGNNTGGADNTTSIPGELDVYGILNPSN